MRADRRRLLKRAVDREWAENIQLLPLINQTEDTNRPKSKFKAALRTGDREQFNGKFPQQARSGPAISAEGGYLRIDAERYPDLIIKKGDKIVALDRTPQTVFEILTVDNRSHLRLICTLGDAR